MRIAQSLSPVVLFGLLAIAMQSVYGESAVDESASGRERGLAAGECIPVCLSQFVVHPGKWRGRPISSGCPSRMYRDTTVVAVHARSPEPALFEVLQAVDTLAGAVDPIPAGADDRETRVYALIFQPESLSNRSDNERVELRNWIASRAQECGLQKTAIAVSASAESHDVDRFGFLPDDDVVIVLSVHGSIRSSYRFRWNQLSDERIAAMVGDIKRALSDTGE